MFSFLSYIPLIEINSELKKYCAHDRQFNID